MPVSHLLDTLNKAQLEAVTAPLEHILVLAGAGSGKTRCLIHRIAWLLETEQARSHHILAVTFTNKAANEMRSRIEALHQNATQALWVGTFHGLAHRLLRIHWQEALLPKSFQILDSDDQLRIVKRVLKDLGMDDKVFSPKQAQYFINSQKDEGRRAQDILVNEDDAWLLQRCRLYQTYEETCQRTGVIDFAELLLRSYELLRDNPALLQHYHQRFQHILVDEFQDTNTIQYQWLRLLAGSSGKLFVVFDDDQSIYGWRGAKIENVQSIQTDLASSHLVRLEQNYRSTGTILEAANALIAHNDNRLGKTLWTEDGKGALINLYQAFDEMEEAEFVVNKILGWKSQLKKLKQVAILYRTTAQSRLFEEALLRYRLPYRIYGGLRFYERLEIKDILAYLRLLVHRDDNGAFERVVNTPKRGIGERTIEILRGVAREQKVSLWEAANGVIERRQLKARAHNTLKGFLDLIKLLSGQVDEMPLSEKIKQIKRTTDLVGHYQKGGKEDAAKRLENLAELESAAFQFEKTHKGSPNLVTAFLDHAALEAGEGQGHSSEDCVQLLTLHAAKGLEFEVVFLGGLEEGLFPHQNSLEEDMLEEERRLCYVGMTRARQQLYLSHTQSRYRYGHREPSIASRFLGEIPVELIHKIRLSSPKVRRFKF